jgi:hypothetical protein
LDTGRVLKLKLLLNEGVVPAVEDPRERSDEGLMPPLVIGVRGDLKVS